MSAIGVSTFFKQGTPVPPDVLLRLVEVNVASLAVCCFCYSLVLGQLRRYLRRAWREDEWWWRAGTLIMSVGCLIDVILLGTAVGAGLRDLASGTYSRKVMDGLYISMKIDLWAIGMTSGTFFALRARMLTPYKSVVWTLYAATAIPFLAAWVFYLMYRFSSFHWGHYSRIFDLVGAYCNVAFAGCTVFVLGWKIVITRRNEVKKLDDSLTALFKGAVATSALIGLSSAGAAICASFLERPKIYIVSSFFLNIYPQLAAISCIFALTQRHNLRRKMSSANSQQIKIDEAGGAEAMALRMARKLGKATDNPGTWRGDKISLGPCLAANGKNQRRDSQRGGEVSFLDVALDTNALERCEAVRSRTGTIDIWVQRESVVTVEEPEEGDDMFLQPHGRRGNASAV